MSLIRSCTLLAHGVSSYKTLHFLTTLLKNISPWDFSSREASIIILWGAFIFFTKCFVARTILSSLYLEIKTNSLVVIKIWQQVVSLEDFLSLLVEKKASEKKYQQLFCTLAFYHLYRIASDDLGRPCSPL